MKKDKIITYNIRNNHIPIYLDILDKKLLRYILLQCYDFFYLCLYRQKNVVVFLNLKCIMNVIINTNSDT